MHDLIRQLTEWLRLLFSPGTGKRRGTNFRPCLPVQAIAERTSIPLPRPRSPYGLDTPLDGAGSLLVRPYLLADEQEAALQRRRRLALVLAADFGIALDRHLIGGQKVVV
ncbi:hypothetical protein ACU639_12925 [Streptomyces cynarae]|uniref:hypothetical protein n=1 Tax=Streptomyces cynarae TaxID=2981134 RepID=UPI00406C7B63